MFRPRLHSIRLVFLLPLIASFALATLLVTGLVIRQSNKAVENVLEELQVSVFALVQNTLDYKLNEALQLNAIQSTHYQQGILNLSEASNRERYLITMLSQFPDAVMTYVALPDGSFYAARRYKDGTLQIGINTASTQGHSEYYRIDALGDKNAFFEVFENFDARKRPWYMAAVAAGEMTFSDIYSHFLFKAPTITASVPIYDASEQLVAVFGVDFMLDWIGKKLSELPLGAKGQVFILDAQQNVVATTTQDPIFTDKNGVAEKLSIWDVENPLLTGIAHEYFNSNLSNGKAECEETQYYYGVEAFKLLGIDWRIFTVIHNADFLQGMNDVQSQMWILLAMIVLIFVIVAFWVTRSVVRPILALNESALSITEGTFEPVKVRRRNDELGQLIKSYNAMGEKLMNLVSHLEEEVVQRTAELEEKNALLNRMSYTDSLSQLANRRRFNTFFSDVLELASRSHRPIAVMMIDIDWFKHFNDHYGHIAGDNCIKRIGSVLNHLIRRHTDLAARYGGEEFVVVLQECELTHARLIAEQIRAEIFALQIPHEVSKWGVVTVSIGLTYRIIAVNETMEMVVDEADRALYCAKDAGRNVVSEHCGKNDETLL